LLTRRRLVWSLILVPIVLYSALCLVLFLIQDRMIFPVGQAGSPYPAPAGAEQVEIASASGERLRGIHIPPARRSGERLLILGFGGNGWNGQSAAVFLAETFPEADVIAFHYRGYPPSGGRPSAAALIADAPLIADFARARVHPGRTVAIGLSIGSGVAASLAAHRPLDGLVLVTPFDSLERVAASQFPWIPVRALFRHRMEPATDLAGSRVPIAIIAAGLDRLVPPERTQALRLAVPNLVFDRTIADFGHNDIYQSPAFRSTIREALAATRRNRP
jgi:pimeloyl-ACP methyl ester carboxylesterase